MRYIFALIFITAASLGAATVRGPHIVSNTTYKMMECAQDPLTPCDGERVVIENPWMVPAAVVVGCGADLDEQEIQVPARTRLTVDIEMTIPVLHPACVIKKASRVR